MEQLWVLGVLIPSLAPFPQPIGLAATFDTELLRRVATVISTELRAITNHEYKTQNVTRQV